MMEYRIETSTDPQYLESTIQQAYRAGWRLQGGLVITRCGDVGFFYGQALVKGE